MKRIEVIPDDEGDIIEATRRMSDAYDFVVTSGGIGPTSVCLTPRMLVTGRELSPKPAMMISHTNQ